MSEEHRPGYYKDHSGEWHRDRRKGGDRRRDGRSADHERRIVGRRAEDQLIRSEHKRMIQEALEDFEVEHKGISADDDE